MESKLGLERQQAQELPTEGNSDHILGEVLNELQEGTATNHDLRERYGISLSVEPLRLGLFTVTINRNGMYESYACDPVGERCSCGAEGRLCLHMMATELAVLPKPEPLYPLLKRSTKTVVRGMRNGA